MNEVAGATPSTYRYSQRINDSLRVVYRIFSEFNDAVNAANKAPDHFSQGQNQYNKLPNILERESKIKQIQTRTGERLAQPLKAIDDDWKKMTKEYNVTGKGTAPRGELLSTMQILLSANGQIAPETFTSILEPLEKDVSALKTIRPVVERTGLSDMFRDTKASRILNAAGILETRMDEAALRYEELANYYPQALALKDFRLLKLAIYNDTFGNAVTAAEQAYDDFERIYNG